LNWAQAASSRQRGEPISGYHDHEIGHTFDRTPHFNAWSESTGTSFKNNVHLYYE